MNEWEGGWERESQRERGRASERRRQIVMFSIQWNEKFQGLLPVEVSAIQTYRYKPLKDKSTKSQRVILSSI